RSAARHAPHPRRLGRDPSGLAPGSLTPKPPGPRRASLCGQPATGEARSLQTAPDVRIFPHDTPDERGALVFDHRADGPLVDAEIIAIDPAEACNIVAVTQRHIEMETRVEGVDEAVPGIYVLPEAAMHLEYRRDRQ